MHAPPKSPITRVGARPPKELLDSTAFLLKRLGWACKDRAMAAFGEVGAAPYHHSVLAVLNEGAPETQATIADALGLDRSYLVGVLDELEERRLVERKRDAADRRRQLVTLTPVGKKELAKQRAIVETLDTELLAPLSLEERDTLHALLLKVAGQDDGE
jgi:DNA-binding MarR family transcriptional regulator